MGPDRRIADYISANRARYTREAITQQLLDSGYEQAAIDATWAVLDAPDPDDVVGKDFWGRFWLYLIALNVGAFLLVGIATQLIPNAVGVAAILGVVIAIGAAIALGIVALVNPTRLGRGAAIAIGGLIPLFFTFLTAGSCYALMSAIGPPAPPPQEGTLTLQIDPPMSLEATGAAWCQPPPSGEDYFNVYTQSTISTSEGPVNVFVGAFAETPGGQPVPSVSISFGDINQVEAPLIDYQPAGGGSEGIELKPGSTATSGSLTFEGFLPSEAFDEEGNPIDRFDADPISGTISWSCET